MMKDNQHKTRFGNPAGTASFINKERISIWGVCDLDFLHEDIRILRHDHKYCLINLGLGLFRNVVLLA